jgi:hypothetical protein
VVAHPTGPRVGDPRPPLERAGRGGLDLKRVRPRNVLSVEVGGAPGPHRR